MNLTEIIEQLESCKYECEAGPLENNVAFIQLKERINEVQNGINIYRADIFEYGNVSNLLNERDWYRVVLKYLWIGEK